jgi:predicted  nucleic acid-binding Zn-ribbon protein
VTNLEVRVERLETWSGPGQNAALADGLKDLRVKVDKILLIQERLQATQERHTKQLTELQSDMTDVKTDVAGLKSDMTDVKTDVAGLKTDVAELKTDVAGLKTDMVEVKDTLKLIVDHLGIKRQNDPSLS